MSRYNDWPEDVRVDPSVFIAPGAVVVGQVHIAARASVWFHSVLRGDSAGITIGADSNIQDMTTVHTDEGYPAIVGARVTVGHRAIVHGCVIEDDCLIGMGAVILTGARIGAGSLIGASALVKENQVIPPGSLAVGAPARVIGPVNDAHREAIRVGAVHYADLGGSYLRRGIGSASPPFADPSAPMPRALEPMDHLEWEQRLDVLHGTPDFIELRFEDEGEGAFRERRDESRWCANEILGHLWDCDSEVFAPRLRAALVNDFPAVPAISAQMWVESRGHRAADALAMLAAWREARAPLLRTLASFTPRQWQRMMVHPVRGPHTIADMVRYWSEHDLSHRRQLRDALGDFA